MQEVPYAEIISYLNEKAGKKFKPIPGNTKYIKARWREGSRLDDFKYVIDVKTAQWKGTEYEKYLRPSTLFNSEKFDAYRNETMPKKHISEKEKALFLKSCEGMTPDEIRERYKDRFGVDL